MSALRIVAHAEITSFIRSVASRRLTVGRWWRRRKLLPINAPYRARMNIIAPIHYHSLLCVWNQYRIHRGPRTVWMCIEQQARDVTAHKWFMHYAANMHVVVVVPRTHAHTNTTPGVSTRIRFALEISKFDRSYALCSVRKHRADR